MIRIWLLGLLRRRGGRLVAAAGGVALAVTLIASLGSFLTASEATMTRRASSTVAVDWQVAVRARGPAAASGGSDTAATTVLQALRRDPATRAALPVNFADTAGLQATTSGTTQTTGQGRVLGLPPSYATTFPGELRLLTGTLDGPLVAQQTAANLRVTPGDTVQIRRPGLPAARVTLAGVVELPQADSLFQRVGAPPQSQLVAPPDNVVLLPSTAFEQVFGKLAATRPQLVTTQIHVARTHQLPADPASAYVAEAGAARNLEVTTSGAGVVGDNLGAALDAARSDAAYSRILFLFLAAPGAALAAALTAAVAESGTERRRREQDLLRARGASVSQLMRLVLVEAGAVAAIGGTAGLLGALLVGRIAFGAVGFGGSAVATLAWSLIALLVGVLIVGLVVILPARRDLVRRRDGRSPSTRPGWLRYGLDVLAVSASIATLWAAGRNTYQLVLAPEGVPQLSVSYWAFLAPALGWLGAALLAWRLTDLLLGPGRRVLAILLRPLAGRLATTGAAMMSRRRRPLARAAVLVGLALAFAMSTATFNATYRQQAEVDAQLTNGADVTVTESPGTLVGPGAADRLAAVPGVRAVQPLQHRFAYVGTDLQDLYGIEAGTISSATALQDPYFQGGTAQQLLSRLGSQPDNVLVSAETVNDFQLKPGDQVTLRLQDAATRAYRSVKFRYAGIVNEFPTAPKDSFLVANAAYVAQETGSDAVGAFLVNTSGSDPTSVASAIRRQVGTSARVTTIGDARGVVGSSLTSVDLSGLTRLELGFALVVALASGGLVVALDLIERRRTVALATLMGATRRQVRSLTAGEPLLVATTGVFTGVLTGWAMSYLLVKMLTGVFDPPPSALALPWSYALAVAVSTVAALGAATSWATRRSAIAARDILREA